MIVADPALQRALVAEAMRAPSVHNVQPARWRFPGDDRVVLFRALDRNLPVADPTGHDVRVSLGAAWEGMAIALSRHGLRPVESMPIREEHARGCEQVAVASIVRHAGAADPLASWVEARSSYRGTFVPAPAGIVARLRQLEADDIRLTPLSANFRELAARYDDASWAFVGQPPYESELYHWLRLRPSHPAWSRDGLNADCLALSKTERQVAGLVLRPPVFAWAKRAGIARPLLSEARQIRSALALVLFAPERALDDMSVGRRFYRLWLELTAIGLSLAPMSAFADHQETARYLCDVFEIPASRRVANVFRVGVPPRSAARSPRLPLDELLV